MAQGFGTKRGTIAHKPAFAQVTSKLRAEFEELASDAYGDFGRRYAYDPVGFAQDCIIWPYGESLTFYQAEAMLKVIERHRIAVRSPHGTGKTTSAALLCLWFALTRDAMGVDWKAPMMASNSRQLEEFLWPEIHKWARRLRWDVIGRKPFDTRLELQTEHIILNHGRAFSMTSTYESGIEGGHGDHVLFMFDEAKAIADGFWDAAEGAFSGGWTGGREAYAVAISTPGAPKGRFYDIHRRAAGYGEWEPIHWRLADAVIAGRISQEWADNLKEKWGETSAVYMSRVLGEFAEEIDGVIPLAWVEDAIERWREWAALGFPGLLTNLGVDVGGGGLNSDKTVIAVIYDRVKIKEFRKFTVQDPHTATMETVGHIVGLMSLGDWIESIVDMNGVGQGVLNRLREQGRLARPFIAQWTTELRDQSGERGFANARSAGLYLLREMLEPESGFEICLPPDDDLIGDLTTPKYKTLSNGKIQVESKDSYSLRLHRSPDTGDAVVHGIIGPIIADEQEQRGGSWYEVGYD